MATLTLITSTSHTLMSRHNTTTAILVRSRSVSAHKDIMARELSPRYLFRESACVISHKINNYRPNNRLRSGITRLTGQSKHASVLCDISLRFATINDAMTKGFISPGPQKNKNQNKKSTRCQLSQKPKRKSSHLL